jgi:polyphosphate kinase
VILVVRREGNSIHRYVHVGTGNYAARTSRQYTDFGLFSADRDLGADLSDLFNVLTGFAYPERFRKIVVAPSHLRQWVIDRIHREAEHARAGRPALILAKMNALVDPEVIHALYEASTAGVEIDLIVRGICCLKPGVPGASEHIRVISILGRFLEHSRAYCFRNDGQNEVYIGSADWMQRNFDRRIEVAVPIRDAEQRETIYGILETMLGDNRQAWDLGPDGVYTQRSPGQEPDRGSHRTFLEKARETGIRLETGTFPITR